MTDPNNKTIPFQNILVAVDASVHSEAGLDAAVFLAHHLGSKVKGLFVRSPELHHICRLTFLSEVSELTGEIRPLSGESMEEQISRAEKRIQHLVQFVEVRSRISCTWTSVVGSVADQILDAAGNTNLIILGQSGRSLSGTKKLAVLAQTVLNESGKPVLIVGREIARGGIVISLYDDTQQSKKGLETALSLAEAIQHPLSVMILTNGLANPDAVFNAVKEQVGKSDIPIDLSLINSFRMWDFIKAVNRFPPGFLVVPKDLPFVKGQRLNYVLDLVKQPLLLIN